MFTMLLGEAPKSPTGYAFDANSPTTIQLARILRIDPANLNRAFFVSNVFDRPQEIASNGFSNFPMNLALEALRNRWFESQRIICLGGRVARSMETLLDLERGTIPQNEFKRFNRTARGSGWELAQIPHPSPYLRGAANEDGLVLPLETCLFLREASAI